MSTITSNDIAVQLRDLADMIETHDLAPLPKYPWQVLPNLFVASSEDLEEIGLRVGAEPLMPTNDWDNGHVHCSYAAFTWIPEKSTDEERRLRDENAALKKQLQEAGQ